VAQDDSGHGHTASLVNASWTSAGQVGAAVALNGTSGHVRINSPGWPTADFSYVLAVYPTRTSAWQSLFNHRSATSWGLSLSLVNGAIRLTADTGLSVQGGYLPLNRWTYVAVTRAGTKVTLYVNGTAVGSTQHGTAFRFGSCPAVLGADLNSGCTFDSSGFFAGRLDEVRIYSRALAATEIPRP
jgi:hypothetical protein